MNGPRDLIIGLATIGGVIALIVILALFGELDRWRYPRYELTIYVDQAAGLRAGSTIELNGVPIGVVDRLALIEAPELAVVVHALIDIDVRITDDAAPYATTNLLGGASTLALETSALHDDTQYLPRDGTAVIREPIRFRMIEQITKELDARMGPLTSALDGFNELSAAYTELGMNLNRLLEPDVDGEPGIHEAIVKINDVLIEVAEATKLAREWLGDEQIRTDARRAVTNAADLTQKAQETLERVNALTTSLEQDANILVSNVLPVADELSRTLEEVYRLSLLARTGQGTIGQLLQRPDLYLALEDAALRLDQALREAQLLIQKLKAEGVKIGL